MMMSPLGWTATPVGRCSWPGVLPRTPNRLLNKPSLEKICHDNAQTCRTWVENLFVEPLSYQNVLNYFDFWLLPVLMFEVNCVSNYRVWLLLFCCCSTLLQFCSFCPLARFVCKNAILFFPDWLIEWYCLYIKRARVQILFIYFIYILVLTGNLKN